VPRARSRDEARPRAVRRRDVRRRRAPADADSEHRRQQLETMSIRATVISEIQRVAQDDKRSLAPLTDDLVLVDSGLNSLASALLMARLEDTLGSDPSTEPRDAAHPATRGSLDRLCDAA